MMGTVEIEQLTVDNDHLREKLGQRDSVKKLHDLVHKIEEENCLPPSPTKTDTFMNAHELNGHKSIRNDDNVNNNDKYSLENIGPLVEFEFDTDMESEDSWLFESPKKSPQTPGRNSENWLKEDTSTPELMRVRGSLSAKLDVIAIENRKGQLERFSNRKDSQEHRRISRHSRRGSGASVNSLDWDYDEAKRQHSNSFSNLSNDEFSYSEERMIGQYEPQYGSDPSLNAPSGMPRNIASQLVSLGKDRQAWSEPGRRNIPVDPNRQFTLDWSDNEEEELQEDLQPMRIDFNNGSPQASLRKSVQVAPNPVVVRRGGSGIAEPRRRDNYDSDDLVARPSGLVKPRRAVMPDETDCRADSPGSDDFNPNAPVVPRGAKKARKSPRKTTPRISFAEHPIIIEDLDEHDIVVSRGSGNIAKPVQRRTPENGAASRLRAPGSGSNLNKLRPAPNMTKSHSSSEISRTDGVRVNLPSGGDGAVVRRRGPPSAESSPSPRRSKEPATARVQGIPQVRRSTGGIPSARNGSTAPRPRTSQSPSGIAKPRGQVVSQSWQADY